MAIRLLDEDDYNTLVQMIEESSGGESTLVSTAIGKIIHVEDAKATSVKTLKLYDSNNSEITSEINIAITNKNLFRIDLIASSTTSNGITFTKNSDGSISASGTSTATYPSTQCALDPNMFVVGKTYTISTGKTSGYLYVQLIINYADSTTDYIVARNSTTTFTISKEVDSVTGSVQITDSGVTLNGETIYPQLELSSVSSDFANNVYNQVAYNGTSMPSLPALISNVWANNDTVADIEMTYVVDVVKALQLLEGKVSYSDLKSLLPMDTASGAIVSITDGQSVIPVDSLKVSLEPIQDLHGYDKPWSGGAGRNLLSVGGRVNQTAAGVRYTSDDNYIILNGTKNGVDYARMENLTLTLPAGTYYAKAIPVSGTATANINVYPFDGSADVVGDIFDSEKSFTLSEEKTFYFRFAVWKDGTVFTNYTVGIVISKTSGIDKFYPYSNICPISGHTEVVTHVSPTTSAEDGTTYTTPLGRTVYGGTLDVVSGVLTVDRAVVEYDGSSDESWAIASTYTIEGQSVKSFGTRLDAIKTASVRHTAISNEFVYHAQTINAYGQFSNIYWNTQNLEIVISGATTLQECQNYLSANPMQVCYELATPQTYQLTPQEVKLLLGNNTIWSDGEVAIIYSADVTKWIEKRVNA